MASLCVFYLEKDEGLQIVGVASDGLEAVQKTIELKPDLVLLSVGLPKLNGIEAAKRISEAVPGVKLLFATQIIDPDINDGGIEQRRARIHLEDRCSTRALARH